MQPLRIQSASLPNPQSSFVPRSRIGPSSGSKRSLCLAWPLLGRSRCLFVQGGICQSPTPRYTVHLFCSWCPHEPCLKPHMPDRELRQTDNPGRCCCRYTWRSWKLWYLHRRTLQDCKRARASVISMSESSIKLADWKYLDEVIRLGLDLIGDGLVPDPVKGIGGLQTQHTALWERNCYWRKCGELSNLSGKRSSVLQFSNSTPLAFRLP